MLDIFLAALTLTGLLISYMFVVSYRSHQYTMSLAHSIACQSHVDDESEAMRHLRECKGCASVVARKLNLPELYVNYALTR